MIARRYMLRLRRDDLDDPTEIAKLSAVAGLSIDQFEEQFRYVVADEPMPRPFFPEEAHSGERFSRPPVIESEK
jgi:6-phosphofructokinase 1